MGSGRVAMRATAVAGVLAAFGFGASAASAVTVPATCATFGATLSTAVSGETIQLSGLCTGSEASNTLPASVTNLTIEGASTGTNGFDGTSATTPALSGTSAGGLAVRNLTFENYAQSAAVNVNQSTGALPTFDSDQFVNNSETSASSIFLAGALVLSLGTGNCSTLSGPLAITNSTFSNNTTTDASTPTTYDVWGAGASALFDCISPSTAAMTITGNTFSGNAIKTAGAQAYGAGFYAGNSGASNLSGQQSGNLFENNSIVSTAAPASSNYDGAGEWLGSVDLTSTADEFIGNSLPGPSGATATSEGAGLGVIRGGCGTPTATTSATATNLVAVDNTIGAPASGGSVEGAGVYAGICAGSQGTGGFDLTLINSTVTGNSGPGGAAGVDGESTDQLTLENTIVNGDTGTGSSEIGGFGGGITATYSDVCNGSSPYTGAGNICADPKLAGVATGDVHESASSPTIDAGSNALVPGGVATDFYGKARIVGTKQAAGIVDIGATEDQTVFSPAPPPPASGPGSATVSGEKATSDGVVVTVSCGGATTKSCDGNLTVTTTENLQGSDVVAVTASKHHKRVVTVAKGRYSLSGGKSVTLTLKLNKKGRALLKRFGKLPVIVKITQVNAAGQQVTFSHRKLTIKLHKNHK